MVLQRSRSYRGGLAEGEAVTVSDRDVYAAAVLLIREHGSEAGVPVLMLALESDRKELRALAIKLLKALTGTDRGFSSEGPADARRDSLRRWSQWWEKLIADEAR